jgi:predicted AAA+ superfamily ATPase
MTTKRKYKTKKSLIETVDVPKKKLVETDEQIGERLAERFQILDDMTQASVNGVVRGMVVTGPPGVGKSYGVEKILDQNNMFDKIAGNRLRYAVEKGAASAVGLYKLLYNYSEKNNVLVLDDCDTVLYDETSLNLLKAALDSGKKRRISWNTDSALLRREGIPGSFEFKGSVIFITNLKFDSVRGKLKDHLAALMSRCHYLDLTLDTVREKLIRCRQIVDAGMLEEYGFTKEEEYEVLNYVIDNQTRMREISLRMITKVADLKQSMPEKWERMVECTCMKRV